MNLRRQHDCATGDADSMDQPTPTTKLIPLPGEERSEVASLLVEDGDETHPAIAEPASGLHRIVLGFEVPVIAAVLAIFLVQVIQVAGRAAGIHIPSWTYEFSRLLLVWMVCI